MCRTFSLPAIKQSDLLHATKAVEFANNSAFVGDLQDICWSDDLLDLLDDFQVEIPLESDSSSSSNSDDASLGYSSLSDESMTDVISTVPSQLELGANFGLRTPEEGFVALPSSKSFSNVVFKTPEMLREEKLNVINPFLDAMNEGDLFSLFSMCQVHCSPDVEINSQSCGFRYSGLTAIATFWTLLFQKHYQGRIQCLQRRISSNVNMPAGCTSSGAFDSVNLVLKLEGCRLMPFQYFNLYQMLMNSGYVQNNMPLHELIPLVDGFHHQCQQSLLSSGQCSAHHLYQTTYLFEVNLRFHAITHTICSWNWELLGVESN